MMYPVNKEVSYRCGSRFLASPPVGTWAVGSSPNLAGVPQRASDDFKAADKDADIKTGHSQKQQSNFVFEAGGVLSVNGDISAPG